MRKATVRRTTNETDVEVAINLDGRGTHNVRTSLNFLDHMLRSFALHGLLDLKIKAKGDTNIDDHHLVEDIAIALGQAIEKALGDKTGIRRFGSALIPMDEVLMLVSLDLSGRPHFESNLEFRRVRIGDLTSEMINHFLKSLADNGRLNLHVSVMKGSNDHHKAEAVFKALGVALSDAVRVNERLRGRTLSEKGAL